MDRHLIEMIVIGTIFGVVLLAAVLHVGTQQGSPPRPRAPVSTSIPDLKPLYRWVNETEAVPM